MLPMFLLRGISREVGIVDCSMLELLLKGVTLGHLVHAAGMGVVGGRMPVREESRSRKRSVVGRKSMQRVGQHCESRLRMVQTHGGCGYW